MKVSLQFESVKRLDIVTRTQNRKSETLRAFVTRTQNRSSKRRGTILAPPRWHEILTITKRTTTSPRGVGTTIKVAIKTISVATQARKAKRF